MTKDIVSQLESLAQIAEVANHHTPDGTMRLMPAAGVADTLLEAADTIRHHQTLQTRRGSIRVVEWVAGTTEDGTPLFHHCIEQFDGWKWNEIPVFLRQPNGSMTERSNP
jgi:hypothetical protein